MRGATKVSQLQSLDTRPHDIRMKIFRVVFFWMPSTSILIALLLLFGLPFLQATDWPTSHQYMTQLNANLTNLGALLTTRDPVD